LVYNIEDDDIVGGSDDFGMAHEIVVNLEEEVEDLNTDPICRSCSGKRS